MLTEKRYHIVLVKIYPSEEKIYTEQTFTFDEFMDAGYRLIAELGYDTFKIKEIEDA
jgi:hypothetical protein